MANKSDDASQKHPLQYKWTLWYDPPKSKSMSGKNWDQNLRPIASFDTVEDFWALFNNLQEPSLLHHGSSYNLFKDGIEPKWEDKANVDGGQWRLPLPNRKELIDEYWMNTLMTVIGEGFCPEDSDDIAGVVVNLRRNGDRISIWTMDAKNEKLQVSIGNRWTQTAIENRKIDYLTFKDQKTSARGIKARYTVG